MIELKLHNLTITTAEPLPNKRVGVLVSAVQVSRGLIATARLKTFEALICSGRPDLDLIDLPHRFLNHFCTLFRCDEKRPDELRRTIARVAELVQILDREFQFAGHENS